MDPSLRVHTRSPALQLLNSQEPVHILAHDARLAVSAAHAFLISVSRVQTYWDDQSRHWTCAPPGERCRPVLIVDCMLAADCRVLFNVYLAPVNVFL